MESFIQNGPVAPLPYSVDQSLRRYLARLLPSSVFSEVDRDLLQFEKRLVSEIIHYANDAHRHPPELIQYSPWGKRIDEIKVSSGWRALDRVSAEEGLVAIGQERKHGAHSRLHQMAKLMLFHPYSAYYSCPLAMTDGAARLIELHGDFELKNNAFKHLTTRRPEQFWTSGQWMTERSGGSDVGNTETIAIQEGSHYRLSGTKWFTSATTSQMAMTLARIKNADGSSVPGNRGLSLFYLELRDHRGELNGIEILRLKDKLGTKALPTAELELKNCKAKLVGKVGEGIKTIASLFNVTRIYNATTTVGAARHLLSLARDYAHKRQAFGRPLSQHPLHLRELARISEDTEAIMALVLYVADLMGKDEVTRDEDASLILRLLTPIAKLYSAKINMQNTSELIESFGGAGFIEDTGLPLWLRDAQVFTIWEGTTNVLSLDLLRAIEKEEALAPYQKECVEKLSLISHHDLLKTRDKLLSDINSLNRQIEDIQNRGELVVRARSIAFAIGNLTAAIQLCCQADWEKTAYALTIAKRFGARDFVNDLGTKWNEGDEKLAALGF
jgi:alkylation response protein AidB-like acyl-CoA dehydrogenase